MTPTITGVFTIRNAIEAGYPFAEAVVSALPLVDEFLINDGGSDDGTREVLERFRDQHPETISLYNIPDFQSSKWDTIDAHLNELIDEASGDWLLEVQADEIWHEDDVARIRDLVAEIDAEGYNSIRQPRYHYQNFHLNTSYVYWIVRIAKNVDGLTSYEGGDNFQIGDRKQTPHDDYTTHYVPPEYVSNIPLYHIPCSFENQYLEQYRRHAEWLATDSDIRQQLYKERLSPEDSHQ